MIYTVHTRAVQIPLTGGMSAIVDAGDVHLVDGFTWIARANHRTHYARREIYAAGRHTWQLMHTLIAGFARTDHINGDGLDNRRANLRETTATLNSQNMRKFRNGTSQFKGVCWYARDEKWWARIKVADRRLNLGMFTTEIDAAVAYDEAARMHFGSHAALNFPRPGERGALEVTR